MDTPVQQQMSKIMAANTPLQQQLDAIVAQGRSQLPADLLQQLLSTIEHLIDPSIIIAQLKKLRG
jgi:hypothetical protein